MEERQRQGKKQEQKQLPEFFFTDRQVTATEKKDREKKAKENRKSGRRKKRGKKRVSHRFSGIIPLPEELTDSDDHEILFAWNLFYILALIAREKLRAKIKKGLPNGIKPIMTFGHKDHIITLATQPWAAEILGIAEIKVFKSPPYCPLGAYTEIITKINGHN